MAWGSLLHEKMTYSNLTLAFTIPISRPFKEVMHFQKMFSDYLLQCSSIQIYLSVACGYLEPQFHPTGNLLTIVFPKSLQQ